MGFVCSVCGEYHAERLLDIRAGLPDPIFAIPAAERDGRTWLGDDFAVLDDRRFFVRGLLEIPIPELDAKFGYGVWLEVDLHEFRQLVRQWNAPEQFDAFTGFLANDLNPYGGTFGLAADAHPVAADKLPAVLLRDADHPLVRDQRAGISARRSDELAATVQHA